ncbi:MAG TPA: CBS domain-containing protein [Solirubrobacteraceae bacterium]|nr:CBS domain-containing protein [Solirubrobacteraceae bacterium]
MPETATQTYHGSYLMPTLEHATVSDAMHPGILSCEPDVSVTEVARVMATHHVHCVAVVGISHGKPECFVWGIISDLDLLAAGIREETETTARDLAAQPVITVRPSMPLREAGEAMVRNGVSHLVVIDGETGRPIGILSTLDVAGVLAWGEA